MSSNTDNYKLFVDLQQKEAQLNWTRNNYFILTSSVLLVAFSQLNFPLTTVLGIVGGVVNACWLLIQYRSSKYIEYYKNQAQEYKPEDVPNIYPSNLGGIEIRNVVLWLPIFFIVLWLSIVIFSFETVRITLGLN